ncbi:Diacylglycerol kinase family enzyme [Colwellia chukchiensis]|uniref:Diacylglycerol kinase family enzyme n=1 Tax=Colwellia chukchiensis TaxID=641665 RepID=A0A1H7PBC5_9GAMM|nr:diacylglycerol kinase family protein [Colwellia chukchiensis]SEL33072.1 Diacylglycerol kinase family enzyme [Colwellia chukchiensis]
MFMVKYYLIGAILAFAGVLLSNTLFSQLIFAWLGFSLALVSLAYIFDLPWIFRKKQNGSIPVYIRWLFIPFLLGTQLYNAWARKHDKVPALQKIDDKLFLACRLFPSDIANLEAEGITAILDVTAEFDGLDWSAESQQLNYLNLPVLDHKSPAAKQLTQAIHWIENQLLNSNAVVVHCALGRGRSVLVMAAYLLSKDKSLTVAQALEKIQGIRATAGLNKTQLSALSGFHQAGTLTLTPSIWLIANPVSGGGKWPANKAEVLQRLSTHFVLRILETSAQTSAQTLTQQAIAEGAKTIIACGGDGTLTEVANEIVQTDITMGILPMGTANALAHVLFGFHTKLIPVGVACDAIIAGKTTKVDSAKCNGNLLLLLAGLGFENEMISRANRAEKDDGGQFAYLQALWQAMNRNEVLRLQVQFDDQASKTIDTTSLVIANAAPFTTVLAQGGGEPNIKDGLLDITWLPPQKNISSNMLSLAELALSGLTPQAKPLQSEHTNAKKVQISAAHKLDYVIDGEVFSASKLSIEILPKSLNILVN